MAAHSLSHIFSVTDTQASRITCPSTLMIIKREHLLQQKPSCIVIQKDPEFYS